ncbi:MAG: dihydroorotate dehydrogenase electron transfer subunit [Actinobacteria bacterium]|nr:dihydroorotate dehydrogenase electron transfer subunit [Actinomycetota bacterium]
MHNDSSRAQSSCSGNQSFKKWPNLDQVAPGLDPKVNINPRAIQKSVEVLSNKKVGSYHHMVFSVGEMALHAKPGNFVAIAVGGESSAMVLRRAFAIYRASDRGNFGGTIELVVAAHGSGSRWLSERAIHDRVDMVGPLGTSFGIPTEPVSALLVGGGYGSAPLFGLAEVLKQRGCRVDIVLGASNANKIYAPLEGKRSVNTMTLTTEDGGAGVKGRVTDVLPQLIEKHKTEIIYSCGPMAMLEAVDEIAQRSQVIHQCAVEESMACGIGVCMTCVIPLKDEAGSIRMQRSCIEGPVVDGSKVIWGSNRKIPPGTWGS